MFIEMLWTDPVQYLTWVVVVAFSICLHEFAHAWVAVHQGDATPIYAGRFSMNPLRVMGPTSLAMLVLFGFAWGAVPVNPGAMRRRWSHFLTALAGPLSNLLLALGFGVLAALALPAGQGTDLRNPFHMLLWTGVAANCFLFLFNMLPAPILDGWTVYAFLLPPLRRISRATQLRLGWIVLLILFLTPAGQFFWSLAGSMAAHIIRGFDAIL